MKRKSKAWTPAARAKRAATIVAKKRARTELELMSGTFKGMEIPLSAIPALPFSKVTKTRAPDPRDALIEALLAYLTWRRP